MGTLGANTISSGEPTKTAAIGKPTVIVIGAGLAGLSAAYRLQQAGFTVTVIESRGRVGGRVKTIRRGGYIIDVGPDAMSSGYLNYRALADSVGLSHNFVPSSSIIGVVRDGKVHDVDTKSLVSMLFTRSLSWRGKMQFLWGLWKMRKMLAGVSSSRLVDFAHLDDGRQNAQEFGEKFLGLEATNYIVDPLVRLVVGSGAREASRLAVLGGMNDWSIPLINIKGGLDSLPLELASRLKVLTGIPAESVSEKNGYVEVTARNVQGELQVMTSDACVIATTYEVAERIYPKLAGYAGDYLKQLRYVTTVAVSLAYSRAPDSGAYVVQVPTVENRDIMLIFLQHNKAPDRVPPGHGLITLYTDTIVTPRYMDQPDEVIEQWARDEVERLFPEVKPYYQFCTITRWPIVGYLATPGFWLRTRDLLNALPKNSNIQVAGDLFGAGSMESAVTWGQRAADRILSHLQP